MEAAARVATFSSHVRLSVVVVAEKTDGVMSFCESWIYKTARNGKEQVTRFLPEFLRANLNPLDKETQTTQRKIIGGEKEA